jgi:hypothetical protein
VIQPLPRLAACTIERKRVTAWLLRYAQMPVRICLAPAGNGKTMALVRYARDRERHVTYVHLKHRPKDRSLESLLCELVECGEIPYNQLLIAFAKCGPMELCIDGIDQLDDAEQALLERMVYEMPANVALIYSGTTTTINVHRLEALGLAALLPREELMFSYEETAELAEELGITANHEQLAALQDHCSGWAMATADVLRYAAAENTLLADAYERWFIQRGRTVAAYLREELERLPVEERNRFEQLITGDVMSENEIISLAAAGAWILVDGNTAVPYNIISDLLGKQELALPQTDSRVFIRLFGRFAIQCGEREVNWIRRRDQYLFRYVAIRPSGRVKKAEVIERFWPDADPHLAAQSLRTACSNIRKGLANAMGAQAADRLFYTDGGELVVDFSGIIVDVHRFRAHINEGQEAENEGHIADALAHYRAAQRLGRADLFGGEPPEEWFAVQREIYREMTTFASERIETLSLEDADYTKAI